MRACTITIPISADGARELPALVVEPDSDQSIASILLFLHGKGEAGSTLGALPLVCVHQTPPFQALLGRLPGTVVIAPQAPPIPTIDDWNWREYVTALAEFLADRYAKQRVVATGFSRGGLGVLQLVSAYPDLVQAWDVVDPQPARDPAERRTRFPSPARTERIASIRFLSPSERRVENGSSLLFDRPLRRTVTQPAGCTRRNGGAGLPWFLLECGGSARRTSTIFWAEICASPSSASTASTPTSSAK
jgi:pimeloyl-ACP methyl ester carboxylesterase